MTAKRRIFWSSLFFFIAALVGPILMAFFGSPPLLGRSIFHSFVDALGPSEINVGQGSLAFPLVLHFSWFGFLGCLTGLLARWSVGPPILFLVFVWLCSSYYSLREYAYGEQPDSELTGFWLAMGVYAIPFLLAFLMAFKESGFRRSSEVSLER